jgi:hypothetical protein
MAGQSNTETLDDKDGFPPHSSAEALLGHSTFEDIRNQWLEAGPSTLLLGCSLSSGRRTNENRR